VSFLISVFFQPVNQRNPARDTMRYGKYIASLIIILICSGTQISAQYRLPLSFEKTDSTNIGTDLNRFAAHVGVHFGDIPGVVFQSGHEYPRIKFFYQQNVVFTKSNYQYNNKSSGNITSTGAFTLLGNITGNMQLVLQYSPMPLDGKATVFNGYGARYRPGVLTDSLHSLSMGIMVQKLASGDFYAKLLDFAIGYNLYYPAFTLHVDATASYVNGEFDLTDIEAIGNSVSGNFERRIIHIGIGLERKWRSVTFAGRLRSNGFILSGGIQIGWSIPSNY